MRIMRPVIFLTVLPWVVGLACSAGSGGTPSSTVKEPTPLPTITPLSITPTVEVIPTIVTPEDEPFFTEEFEAGYEAENWQTFNLGKGDMNQLVVKQEEEHLLFDLGAEDLYIYYMYKPYTYRNIALTLRAQNLGRNNNNISLICHMSSDASTWYEFSVASSGLWSLFAMDKIYHILASGGTNALEQETGMNEYQMICKGNEIVLLVNGEQLRTITETRYQFSEGFVGFNVSSIKDYSVLPITVAVDSFQVDLP